MVIGRGKTVHFAQGLSGVLELPADGDPLAYALFAHCFTCTKNLPAAIEVSRALARRGFGVLRFDFSGLGDSEGEFTKGGFVANIQELMDAAEFLQSHYEAPQLIVGHSLGGAAAIMAAAQLDFVRAVATIGAPACTEHVMDLFSEQLEDIQEKGKAEVKLAGRHFFIHKKFVDDLKETQMHKTLGELKRPLLILHAPKDEVVGVDHARRLFEAARHPKSFISLDEADHLLKSPADACYVGSLIASWAERYLSIQEKKRDRALENRVITMTSSEQFLTEIRVREHSLLADEPPSMGGGDQGPTPYDLLLSSLGACTGMTLQMYAKKKKWPLEGVQISLTHQRVHAEDCQDCQSEEGQVDEIQRELVLFGDLSAEQRKRLSEIADRCPVHRTLT